MHEDKTGIRELVYLSRLRQGTLPGIRRAVGWSADVRHSRRRRGDFCPFQCQFCEEQRHLDSHLETEQKLAR